MACAKGLFGCAFILIALLHSATADTHVVLDTLGWIVPPAGSVAYTTWAANQNFETSDVLVFNFNTGTHNVAQVTKAAFEACTRANPISLVTNGPANITLNATGEYHFICTVGTHCDLGQKLAINVSSSTSGPVSPGSPTTPTTPSPPPPPPSSASSTAVGGFSIALLSIAMAVLY